MKNQDAGKPSHKLPTLAHQLQYCTSRIQVRYRDGGCGIGTGFFFDFSLPDGKQIPTLVTNKHVVRDAIEVTFTVHIANHNCTSPSGYIKHVKLDGILHPWFEHPDKDTDICVLPLQPYLEILGGKVFKIAIGEDICWSDEKISELNAIEDVVMVGYPRGLCDEANNFPIFRRGITATNPFSDFQGRAEGAVDIAAFHGSSGSPIFIYNCGAYAAKGAITFGYRAVFLGVLYAGPVIEKSGKTFINTIPVREEDQKGVIQTIHLGYYVKAKKLLEIKKSLCEAKVKLDISIEHEATV